VGGAVEVGLLLAGVASTVIAILGRRAMLAAFVLLTAGIAVRAWRWFAILSPEGQPLFESATFALPLLWLFTGVVSFALVRRSVARITGAAGFLLAATWLVLLMTGARQDATVAAGGTDSIAAPYGGQVEITHLSVSRFEVPGGTVVAATADVQRGRASPRTMVSERRSQFDVMGRPLGPPMIQPALSRGLLSDLRIELASAAAQTDEATYRVRAGPPTWLGALSLVLLMAGVLLGAQGPQPPGRDR
jgi:hypothetical protein